MSESVTWAMPVMMLACAIPVILCTAAADGIGMTNLLQSIWMKFRHTCTDESEMSSTQKLQRSSSPTKDNATRNKKSSSSDRPITWTELKEHCTENNNNGWIAIHGKVYDITNFAKNHPGGSIISDYVGRNASDEFDAFHLPRVRRRLPAYCIGTLVTNEDSATGTGAAACAPPKELPSTRDYRELRTKLWNNGWFEADVKYYLCKDLIALGILLLGLSFMTMGTSVLVRTILGGLTVGLAIQQVAFVAHDAGHYGILPPKAGGGMNWLGWFHGSVCFGISIDMWSDEHSKHHAMTMRPRQDPQFNYLPFFLVSKKELSKFDELSSIEQVLARWLVPFQHLTLIPLSVIIGRFNLHAISMIHALKNKKFHDVLGMFLYVAWFGSMVCTLPNEERIPFVLVSYMMAGVLHIQLTISHLATDAFTAEEDEHLQFFAHQCRTTRNIDSYWWDDWFHGGLQYQIEHHLFPQLPRHNLAKVQPMVKDLCAKHNIPYRSTSFTGAIGECLSDFHRMRNFIDDLYYPQG
mmetsp:Transcript_417/g.501  ORF Transcript_417/g.501 Transcript_417/m.501 type:complete len:522 (-) Transcript_417:215-1780(-)|eukprot:CAMPEP_0204644660 /NCGR_PEP_ID=MMETSP0718-20130828/1644_1 /ASSEMBLY_ACC=CAM_ASM_000674 /TAXON_ID=230516 /ORGANISM="Chaetoceros curvisetus" /LENGTH=521 /DNA_ID=CAMNT_0051666305 /DNA_START=31 /DNA_END=1596 /DNA_ORIENTATION=-